MTNERVSDNQLVLLIEALEANGKARSINMNRELAAFRELQERRAAERRAVEPASELVPYPGGDMTATEVLERLGKPACEHEWRLVSGQLDAQGEFYIDRCTRCNKERQRRIAPL